MTESQTKSFEPIFNNPLDSSPGLTINDLNRYLPAIQTLEDLSMNADEMKEGLFLSEGSIGLKNLPDQCIDLIVTEPPREPWLDIDSRGSQMTLQEYYDWNQNWLSDAQRVLKNTGGIYLISDWYHSSMYYGLLSNNFIIQNRITWHNRSAEKRSISSTWKNQSGDIWFATKNDDFLFDNHAVSLKSDRDELIHHRDERLQTNFWFDIPAVKKQDARYSDKLYAKMLEASSFKLNWILDPFMRNGDVGVSAKKIGRRFIGFETNKDLLLLSMKRIDQKNNQ
tara:strand:+ start:13643 stop:14485 length:843 start_codon:yes stop_codon:yes gene_type:complete